MAQIRLSETLPFTAQQMYDLVVDVRSYTKFLPWCVAVRIWDETPEQFMAELTVAFKGIRESFQTLDRIVAGQSVEINLRSGPFQYLVSTWKFIPDGEKCRVDFFIDFRFQSRLKEMALGPVFSQASRQMLSAFRKRAQDLYGR